MGVHRGYSAVILCLLVLVAGCARTTAPRGWLPDTLEVQSQAFGGWVEVTYFDGPRKDEAHGELIAIDDQHVRVLTSVELVAIPRAAVSRVRLTSYRPEQRGVVGWTVLGTLSTLSHGIVLVLSAPAWILCGCVAGSVRSYEGQPSRVSLSRSDVEALRAYARFPNGLPEGLDPQSLARKWSRRPETPRKHSGAAATIAVFVGLVLAFMLVEGD